MTSSWRVAELWRVAVACIAMQAVVACGDNESPSGPGTGSLKVTVATTGADLDPDGFAISVDNGQAQAVPINGSVTIGSVPSGSRSVALTGLAPNCTADPGTRTITVAGGAEATVNFSVTCVAAQGAVQVTVQTTGDAPDPDGYAASLDGGPSQAVGVNGAVAFPAVAAGPHSVTLAGLAAGCVVNGSNPRPVDVTTGATVPLTFAVVCSTATGSIAVAVATTGDEVDASGYLVSVDGGTGAVVPANGSLSVPSLTAGPHSVQLLDVAANCEVTGQNPQTATVTGGASTPVAFQITCSSARILFISTRDGNFDLYSSNRDGSSVQRLTTTAASEDAPAWSPDYSKIAFASNRGTTGYDIYVMNADGSGATQLTTADDDDNFPSWSRDGSKIAFTSNRDGNDEIYVMNADGSGQVNLTNNAGKDQVPAWSPDGVHLAFQSDRDGATGRFEIFTIQADGTALTKIVSSPAGDFHPTYSPSGLRLLFASTRDDPEWEIYVVNVDGTGLQRLTTAASVDNWPTWSPDGTSIAFYSNRDGNSEIYTMDESGGNVARVTNEPQQDLRPAWRP